MGVNISKTDLHQAELIQPDQVFRADNLTSRRVTPLTRCKLFLDHCAYEHQLTRYSDRRRFPQRRPPEDANCR